MERDNRKSHLAPQLSPATQDLLRSTDSPTFFNQTITAPDKESRSMQTPTSGEIPIMGTIGSSRDQYVGNRVIPESTSRSTNRSPPPARGGGQAVGGQAVGERVGGAGGSPVHPGMGPRVATTGGIVPQQQQRVRETVLSMGGPRSAGRQPATFTLPVRPGGGGGSRPQPPSLDSRPPPPPRKETAEEAASRRESSRRQAAFSPPVDGGYGGGSGYAH